MKILIVDDEKEIRELLIDHIGHNDELEFFQADSGKSAINIIESEKMNLVITDQQMPDGTGEDIIRFIEKKYDAHKGIDHHPPMVFLISSHGSSSLQTIIEKENWDYFVFAYSKIGEESIFDRIESLVHDILLNNDEL